MFVGKYLLYEAQCVKHEHSTQIQCVYCFELRLYIGFNFLYYTRNSNKNLRKIAFFIPKRYKNGSETKVGVRAVILCRF